MFELMADMDKVHDLVFINKFSPFVHVFDKSAVPDHCRANKQIQMPTRSWNKIKQAVMDISENSTKIEFMKQLLLVVGSYPRLCIESYVCSNLDSLDGLVTNFVAYVEMRMVLSDLQGHGRPAGI